MDYFYVFILAAALLISLLGLWFTVVIPGLDHWNKRFFCAYFFDIMLCCLCSIIERAFYFYSVPFGAIYFIWILESLLMALPAPMLTIYLVHCSGDDMRKSCLFRSVAGFGAVFLALVAATPFVGGYAYITEDMQYRRRPIYPIMIMPVTVIMLLNLGGVLVRQKKLSRKVFLAFLVVIIPLTVAFSIQMFTDAFVLLDSSIVISALVMYSFVLSDQIEQNIRYQQEIAHQRANIMVLQMRPHFIYNTMTSAYCLCNQDPQRARQVIMDFLTYLRRNFTAIVSKEPIPFSAELEHTRAYLAVEKAQYEETLFVEYDTPHTYFRLPPLTLQPVVENAIQHGRDPYAGAFHVSIRTRKTDSGSQIVVADDGRGYTDSDDSEPHIALKNIQERLKLMCGGRMTIAPGDSGGTVVTITVPDDPAGSKKFDNLEHPP